MSKLSLNTREVVPPVTGLRASGNGSLTFDVMRDASNNVTGGNVVFYVNYDFPGSVTITGLSLNQGAKGANGPVVIDAGTGTVTDTDGHGNLTKVVTGVSASVLTRRARQSARVLRDADDVGEPERRAPRPARVAAAPLAAAAMQVRSRVGGRTCIDSGCGATAHSAAPA